MDKIKHWYKGKKVFITGHTGFKGSWLIYWLHLLGANTKGFALKAEPKSLYHSIDGDSLCDSVLDDIRNFERLQAELVSFQPDLILHFAAQSLVRESYRNPLYTFEVNTLGTANLLESIRSLEKKCGVIIITTDKVYENREWIYPYRETDRLGGYDSYSSSKACAELIVDSYRNSFFGIKKYSNHKKTIAVARAGNVIGGGDWSKDRLIPDIVRALSAGERLIIRNPGAIRPWQHVVEPLFGYLYLGMKLDENPEEFCGAWNFGPNVDDNISVLEVVKQALKIWGKGTYLIQPDIENMHEAQVLKLEISKAIDKLGWKPVYRAELAIRRTIQWYKSYLVNPASSRQLIEKDIEAYTTSLIDQKIGSRYNAFES